MNTNDLKVGDKVKVVAIRAGFEDVASAKFKGFTGTVTDIILQGPDNSGRGCNLAEVRFENGSHYNYFIQDEIELVQPALNKDEILPIPDVEGPFVRFRGILWSKKDVEKKIATHEKEVANFKSLLTLFK